ncbi:hypothetical protein FKM82_008902 [Ascaphus truei]
MCLTVWELNMMRVWYALLLHTVSMVTSHSSSAQPSPKLTKTTTVAYLCKGKALQTYHPLTNPFLSWHVKRKWL